jgi:serine/threonine protein kinase
MEARGFRAGEILDGQYQIDRLLGDGAMGEVYAAFNIPLKRHVALKVLTDKLLRVPVAGERMAREAEALARLQHPNVITIFRYFSHGDLPILELELVTGGTLADRISRGPLRVEEALSIMRCVLSALAAIHRVGLVHRDIKPSNILLTKEGIP